MTTQCGLVAIIGAPNAGKSTLINALVGSKIAIVTPKPQTTRYAIRGICGHKKSQLIFIDTPGIFAAKPKFEQAMVEAAWHAVKDADAVLLMIDAEKGIDNLTREILSSLRKQGSCRTSKHDLQDSRFRGNDNAQCLAAFNKIDRIPKGKLLELSQELLSLGNFAEIFMISALKNDGVAALKSALAAAMPEGPWLYPDDQLTDSNLRDISAEMTREQCFMLLRQELPYNLMVETEGWAERPDGKLHITQTITVARETHKKMVLGEKGATLKSIGSKARLNIQRFLHRGVHLELFVRVRENWKNNKEAFRAHHLQ